MNLVLFDFDGTITRGDTFSGFLHFAVSRRRVVLGAVLFAPVILLYRLGLLSGRQARPIVSRVGFQGEPAEAIRELGRRYAAEVLPRVVRQRAIDRIREHLRQGDTVVVVSASLNAYLDPWCERMGVEGICTALEEHDGRLTGRYRLGDCSGPAKVRRIRERYDLSRYSAIYAYGDTHDDREMLDLAHRKYYRWREIAEWSEAVSLGVEDPRRVSDDSF
jgi:HAD superfamily hydrolase (TIGR01490 family)